MLLLFLSHGDGHKTDSQAHNSLKESSRESQGVFEMSVTVLHANTAREERERERKKHETNGKKNCKTNRKAHAKTSEKNSK